MKTIYAADLYIHWKNFFDVRPDKDCWAEQWKKSSTWTKYALGEAFANEMDCAFGKYMVTQYKGLRFRTEDAKVDMTMSLHDNFKSLVTLNKQWQLYISLT